MKSVFLPFLAALVLPFVCYSQQPVPRPTPPAEDVEVVRIGTNLIQLDVTVVDKKGEPVKDIRPDEIEIYENGKKQSISNLTFVSGTGTRVSRSDKAAREKTEQSVRLPPAPPNPTSIRRTIAIVVDDLTLSFPSTFWVKKALKKYIEEQIQDGDFVAIVRTSGGMGALQQFTTDRRQLMAAVDKLRFDMRGSSKISAFAPIAPTLKQELRGSTVVGGDKDFGDQIEREREQEQEIEEFRSSAFAVGTLGAISYVVRGMGELPGRKSVLVMSDGFSLITRRSGQLPSATVVLESLRRLSDIANRASVTLYTIDPRGLEYTGISAADNTSGMTDLEIAAEANDREANFRDTQQSLRLLADQTGGFAIYNQNDISAAIAKVMNDQSYYLVGYIPDDDTFDPKTRRYNKIEVRVKRDGVRVRYRSGFFSVTDEQADIASQPAENKMVNALLSPFAVNEIPLRLHAVFAADNKNTQYVKSYVHIPATDLTFTKEGNGKHQGSFDVIAMAFGDNGVLIDSFSRNYTLTLTDDMHRRAMERGVVYQFAFPVKKSGGYQYRVALRDTVSNKVGSANQFIEVPNLGKKRLTMSGLVLEAMPKSLWTRISTGVATEGEIARGTDAERDTALRQFKQGNVLRYGTTVFNANLPQNTANGLTAQMRIFKDGELHFEGKPFPVNPASQGVAEIVGGMSLGKDMPPGDYIMQITVTGIGSNNKPRVTSQVVQFEIVE